MSSERAEGTQSLEVMTKGRLSVLGREWEWIVGRLSLGSSLIPALVPGRPGTAPFPQSADGRTMASVRGAAWLGRVSVNPGVLRPALRGPREERGGQQSEGQPSLPPRHSTPDVRERAMGWRGGGLSHF